MLGVITEKSTYFHWSNTKVLRSEVAEQLRFGP